MICPRCFKKTEVYSTNTKTAKLGFVRRYRKCTGKNCKFSFRTRESVEKQAA